MRTRVDLLPERALDERVLYEKLGWEPHAGQGEVIDSLCRNKVVSAGRRFGKSEIGGHKLVQEALNTRLVKTRLEELGKRREFWVIGPSYCVDSETECLTQRGWLRYEQIQEGDFALGQNPTTGLAEWTPVEKVSVFPAGPREMVYSRFRGHESLTTLDHRWLVEWGTPGVPYSTNRGVGRPGGGEGTNGASGWRFVTSESLFKSNERVYAAQPVTNLPVEPKYTDAFVELVAWYWTEGCLYESSGYVSIAQNPGPNLDRIKAACTALLGPEKASLRSGSVPGQPGWRVEAGGDAVNLNGAASEALRGVCLGIEKVVTSEFLTSLTQAQLDLFIWASIRGDADSDWEWQRPPGGANVQLGQKSERRADAFQMACQLAGLHTVKTVSKNDYGPYYYISVYERGKIQKWCASTYAANSARVTHLGIVWCPTTGTGTWLARRNGQVFFTGNSDSEKEFRVLWNTLSKAGLREYFDKPGSYNNPEQGDLHLSLWGGRFQCHAKSEKHPDSLVGEGLSGVVLAEAAKLKERTWNKLIRPTLADYNGWALMTSTPEGKNWFYDMWRHGQDPTRPEWASWRMPSWVNPYVYPDGASDEAISALRLVMGGPQMMDQGLFTMLGLDPEIGNLVVDLTEESFNQEIAALFTEFVGRVFKTFDEESHVGDFTFDRSWKTYAAADLGFCVDTETEILTAQGWKRQNEVAAGDTCLSINPATGLAEWDTVQDVKRFQVDELMVRMKSKSHDSLTTGDHRWLCEWDDWKRTPGRYRFKTSDTFTDNDWVPTAAPVVNLPQEQKYTDALVELVAWYWTEGSRWRGGNSKGDRLGGEITQNLGPKHDQIRAALTTLFGSETGSMREGSRRVRSPKWRSFARLNGTAGGGFLLNGPALAVILEHVEGQDKIVRPEFISSLTLAQLHLFINTSVAADGASVGASRIVGQSVWQRLEPLQMACQLAGFQTVLRQTPTLGERYGDLTIFSRYKRFHPKSIRSPEHYRGTVWCPTTGNGTWLARRNGTVYFTGNCNPSVWLLIQVDPFGERVRVLDEVYEAGLTVNEFADLVRTRGLAPEECLGLYSDPASPGDNRILSDALKIPSRGGTGGELRWRIDAIRSALKTRHPHLDEDDPERIPSLQFDRRCVRSIADMLNYRYPERRQQADQNSPENPLKKDDHAPEALGRFYAGHFGTPDKQARRARARRSTLVKG